MCSQLQPGSLQTEQILTLQSSGLFRQEAQMALPCHYLDFLQLLSVSSRSVSELCPTPLPAWKSTGLLGALLLPRSCTSGG